MINPIWLNTFCTLIRVGHFTHTANVLNMTQSGVSQHIKKLEAYLGKPLLQREGKSFHLTDAGRQLAHQGQPLLDALQQLEQTVGEDPPFAGTVRVMSPGSVGLKLYPALLTLQQAHPDLVIDYRFAPNPSIERAAMEGNIDIGLMTLPSRRPDLISESVASEALKLVTPAEVDHIDWPMLQRLGFVDHPDGAHHAQLLLQPNFPEFEQSEPLPVRGFSNQISLILEPVAAGLGFTVLPAFAIEAFTPAERIRVQPLPISVEETLYTVRHRRQSLPNRVSTVLGLMRSLL